jgi:hypothetical protein
MTIEQCLNGNVLSNTHNKMGRLLSKITLSEKQKKPLMTSQERVQVRISTKKVLGLI